IKCMNHTGHKEKHTAKQVIGIHVEYFIVQPAQISVCLLDVIHVLHCFVQCLQHHLAMGYHFGVIQNSRRGEDVSKCAEIPFGPGVDNQNSVSIRDIVISSDRAALLFCKLNHDISLISIQLVCRPHIKLKNDQLLC
uniref:Uncharacterized protein n=1 Tax=Lates calcarifer TaxID=8187 RepID=A0A4W6BUS3_LATCA